MEPTDPTRRRLVSLTATGLAMGTSGCATGILGGNSSSDPRQMSVQNSCGDRFYFCERNGCVQFRVKSVNQSKIRVSVTSCNDVGGGKATVTDSDGNTVDEGTIPNTGTGVVLTVGDSGEYVLSVDYDGDGQADCEVTFTWGC